MRRDLNAPDLRWVIPELPDQMRWGNERLAEFDAQIAKVAASDPRVWFLPTNAIQIEDGSVTFGTRGNIALGRLLARHYLSLK